MRLTSSLRLRGAVAFFAAGALLSALFAFAIYLFVQDMEIRFIDATLGVQMEHFTEMAAADPQARRPNAAAMDAFMMPPDAPAMLPPYLAGLEPGTYDGLMHEGLEYHAMVSDHDGRRYYLAYASSELEAYEALFYHFLSAAALVFALAALGLGYWMSGRIIEPVTRLAHDVRQSSPEGDPIRLSSDYAGDEVGELAQTFDAYAERLRRFAQREQQFTADVTHELRTPVAVMRTTVELLQAEQDLGPTTRQRLTRLERAVNQMSELIGVFLVLAREPRLSDQEPPETCAVEPVLREVVDTRAAKSEAKGLDMRANVRGNPVVDAPATVVGVVIGDLLDNAIAYTERGSISLTLDEGSVTIADTGVGIPEDMLPRIFERGYRGHRAMGEGAGLGLYIVKRICERQGWGIEVESEAGKGTQVRVAFTS